MNQDVLIKVCGLQIVEETGDNVEVLAQGKHYVKKDKHYILSAGKGLDGCATSGRKRGNA